MQGDQTAILAFSSRHCSPIGAIDHITNPVGNLFILLKPLYMRFVEDPIAVDLERSELHLLAALRAFHSARPWMLSEVLVDLIELQLSDPCGGIDPPGFSYSSYRIGINLAPDILPIEYQFDH